MKIYWLAFWIIIFDQITKWMVKHWMILHDSIPLIGTTVQLTYLENPGMAFGIRFFETHPFWGRWFFSIVSILASIGLIWYIYRMRHERRMYRVSLALILGGAVGNLIDRVTFGRVVDFMDVDIPDLFGMQRWPVFNVADSSVVLGMIVMSAFVMFTKHEKEHVQVDVEETQTMIGTKKEMAE
ncbi:signal peptidase II [bacterium]|nr:signal peptidase II [bacterium]